MHVIYSDLISGVGLLSGGPYGDINSDEQADYASAGVSKANDYFNWNLIDNLDNLENDPVYIFSGVKDEIVWPIKQESQRDFYDNFSSDIKYVSKNDVGHYVPSVFSDKYGEWK